jgi:hypothetical protein
MVNLKRLGPRQALFGALAIASVATMVACSGAPNDTATPTTPTTASASASTGFPALGIELPPAEIPWDRVGPGWMIATWSAAPSLHPGQTPPEGQPLVAPLSVYLLDPAGGRYAITTFPVDGTTDKDPGHVPDLVDWSGDGKHALFEDRASCPSSFVDHKWRCNDPNAPEQYTTIVDVDLTTGAKHGFTVDHWANGTYSGPSGEAVLVSSNFGTDKEPLKRVDLSGKEQLTFPEEMGSNLAFPDGTQMVFGAADGLAVGSNDGVVSRKLAMPAPVTHCSPVRWWTRAVILTQCHLSEPSGGQLWQVPLDGGRPTALTAVNSGDGDTPGFEGDLGDVNAWQLPSGTFLQSLGACGSSFLSRLTPDGHTARIDVPGAEGSVDVVGATADKLVLQTRLGCGDGTALITFDPAANTIAVLLGPPVNGGSVKNAFLFPTIT